MKRREFITLASATAAWPLAARAQQQMRRIGVLIGNAVNADDPVARDLLPPFQTAMQSAGWIEGKNIRVHYRFSEGNQGKTSAAAAELVALAPELILALGAPAAQALHQQTRTIPIVFARAADPVGFGLVASLSRPGGNVTGFMAWELSIGGKWMQLLREIAPGRNRIGILYNPDTGTYAPALIASAKAAAGRDVEVIEYPVRDDRGIEAAASELGRDRQGGLLVIPEPFTNARRDQIIVQAARFGVPTMMSIVRAAARGALISYTFASDAMMRQTVSYIDRILKGESPSDLPVQAPTKFELAINLKTAKALGLTVPPTVLATADEVIE